MNDEVLTQRQLLVALLDRQLLLERPSLSIPAALEQVAGLQTQYAPSGYVGLWTRLARFERHSLTKALEDRAVVQGTLMRGTIHLVSAREYWLFAMGVRRARREWAVRVQPGRSTERSYEKHARDLRKALEGGPRSVADLGGLASGFVGNVGLWVDLVRVPPSGTWERRRADVLALADDWIGPCRVTEEEGLDHLVRSYLRGFGPAPLKDVASWAGVPVTGLKSSLERLELRRFRDETGKELLDLPDARPAGAADVTTPVRFLPHWDANLLVHARRTGLLPEPYRARVFSTKNPFSVGVVLADGVVVAAWSVKDGRVRVEPYEKVPARVQRQIDAEAGRLERFHTDP